MDRELAQILGRIGAYRLHALYPASQTTRAAREAFLARFEREVDPEGILDAEDRAARAAAARKAYMLRMALKSRNARRSRAQAATGLAADQAPVSGRA
jgi:hypothetical protein